MRALRTLCIASIVSAAALADEKASNLVAREATGEAAIVNGNELKAFDDAKKAALRNAIEQVAGVAVQGDTLTKNNQLVMDRVVAHSDGFVRKFDVLSKSTDKGVMTVKVRAEVGVAELQKDLVAVRGIVDRLGRSKLLVVVSENSIDDKGISSRSELVPTELTRVMRKDGWTIVDEKSTGDKLVVAAGVAQGKLDPKEVAKKSDADYVIYGSVNVRYLQPNGDQFGLGHDSAGNQNYFPITADYDLSMFETSTGRQLAKIAGKFDQSQLVKKLATLTVSYTRSAIAFTQIEAPRLVDELRTQAVEALRDQDVNGSAVTMQVSNVPDLDAVDDLEKALGTITGVRGVKMSGDYKDGKVEFEVGFTGSSRELGRAVGATTFKKRKLTVTAVQHNRLEVAIAK